MGNEEEFDSFGFLSSISYFKNDYWKEINPNA